ncbi:hypothetical protein [Chroococcidiopsis sp. CCMEE 29]|uniref:hypothetical protein n=1 Tax=Chroococcidiopsis sp. CCMEE 29 TaxID=155894 RepID=UPI0020221F08|nr:hypothetical protein [Chroococcidiopsis sp. CCMEE 29]
MSEISDFLLAAPAALGGKAVTTYLKVGAFQTTVTLQVIGTRCNKKEKLMADASERKMLGIG